MIGALAGKFTGWPIASLYSSSSLNADSLTVKTIFGPRNAVSVNHTLHANNGLYAMASAGNIAVYGYSPAGRAVNGNTDTGYAGFFQGGKGVYAQKIEFGAPAFNRDNGYLALFADLGRTCNQICLNHGLGATKELALGATGAFTLRSCGTSCSTSADQRLCLCGI